MAPSGCPSSSGSMIKASPKFTMLDRVGETIQWYGSNLYHAHDFSATTAGQGSRDWGTTEFIETKALDSYLLIEDDDCCRIRCDVTVITAVPHPPSGLGDVLLASEAGKDVTFVVGGERFTAHSCVLAARTSKAFMAAVLAGKESAGGCRHVRVDGMAKWVFGPLLHFIYTDSLPDVPEGESDFELVCDLLEVADRYGMERLKMVCTDVLRSSIFPSTALSTLRLSNKVGCLKLNQACVEFIGDMLRGFNLEQRN